MIDFRYHVVSIVAVFLALALGLFLGSTTLQSTVTDQLSGQAKQVRNENKQLEIKNDLLRGQLKSITQFDVAAEPQVVKGQLAGQSVAVVSAPGVSDKVRSQLETTLLNAGATLASDVRLASGYLDPTESGELAGLAKLLTPNGHAPPAGTGVQQADQILANVLLTRPNRASSTAQRIQATLSAFADGKLLSVQNAATVRAGSVAVVLLPGAQPAQQAAAEQTRAHDLLDLAHALAASGQASVVAGPTIVAGEPASELQDLRSDSGTTNATPVSTVDAVDAAYGRIATVYALAERLRGGSGSYGLAGQASLPSPSPSTTS